MEFLSIVMKVAFNVNKMFNQTKYVDIFIFDKFFYVIFIYRKNYQIRTSVLHSLFTFNYSGYYNIERSNYRYILYSV